jgi:glycine hydroxymethyltransferase
MKEPEMEQLTEAINLAITAGDDSSKLEQAKAIVADLCKRFPLYIGIR